MTVRRPLKGLVDVTGHFRRIPLPALVLIALAASVLAARAWSSSWVGVGLGLLVLGDWVMLSALPHFGRSYGEPQLPWLSLLALRLVPVLVGALASSGVVLAVVAAFQAILTLTATYACWVEPARLELTQVTLPSPHLNGCPPLRLLQISDLHIERLTSREQELLRLVRRLEPDVIVITGDYLNISFTHDPTAQRQAHELLSQLRAARGVYAITGSPSVDPPHVLARLMDGNGVTWLQDQVTTIEWHGCRLRVVGMTCSYDIEADAARLRRLVTRWAAESAGREDGRRPPRECTLLLYHTPDLMPAASRLDIDLYLAGHTHGGQLRVPSFGALVTASIHGKRYEMGAYRERGTLLYVSRGVGLEGKGAPRARFLCRPEITLFTLRGNDG